MNESERDPRLDAAWSAASREQPPPALDAAIRAAARRGLDGAPRTRRRRQWWYPVAAAATVALLAVGIAQLTPPERVAPAVVSDTAPAPRERRQDSAAPAAEAPVAEAPAAAPSPVLKQRSYAAEEPGRAPEAKITGEHSRAPSMAAQKPAGAAGAERSRPAESSLQDRTIQAAAEQGAPAAAREAATPPSSNPFPAAAPAAQAARDENVAANAPPPAAAPAAQLASRAALARSAPAVDTMTQTAAERRVEEWIKRIRDLKNAGRLDEAAKELAAFRSAYGAQADALLPADLRSAKPE